MSSLDRRDLMRFVAGGAAVTAAVPALATASEVSAAAPLAPDLASERTRTAERLPIGAAAAPIRGEATVGLCRSFDAQIYLQLGKRVRGFVAVEARGFAIAAACQAAGRKVAVQAWGHDPDANGGLGHFDGAVLAIDACDLPGADSFGELS
ncbi:MAG: hypothetical protein IPN34_15965 [Planctomycetes bacterium]|nr:hypothetical protein [Planctomycetota bacterium]